MSVHGDGVLVSSKGRKTHIRERVAMALEVQHGGTGGQVPPDTIPIGTESESRVRREGGRGSEGSARVMVQVTMLVKRTKLW